MNTHLLPNITAFLNYKIFNSFVLASWMKRYASEEESKTLEVPFKLSPLQEEKLLNFFKYYLDGDCDGFVFEHDFHQFAEV